MSEETENNDTNDKNWTRVPMRKGITQFLKRPKSLNVHPNLKM